MKTGVWISILAALAFCFAEYDNEEIKSDFLDLSIYTDHARRAFEVGAWSVAGDVPSQQYFSMAFSQESSSVLACGGYMFCLSNRPFTPGSVYLSLNNGNSWTQMPLNSSYAWTSCGVSANGRVLVASAATARCNTNSNVNMRVYISTNGGTDWTWANPTNDFGAVWSGYGYGPYTAVSETGQYIWLADASNTNNALSYSQDSGVTWTFVDNCAGNTQYTCTDQIGSIAMSTQNNGQYVLITNFNNYAAQLSTNSGTSWRQLLVPGTTNTVINGDSCVMSGSGQYMAIASSANYNVLQLYVSNNYGASFVTANFSATGSWPSTFQAISMSQSGLIIAIAAQNAARTANLVYMSYDAGSKWSILSDPLTELTSVSTLVLSGPAEYMLASNVYQTAPIYVYQTNLTAYPTSWPTAIPTSAPSCFGGKAHGSTGSACYPCPEGYASQPGGVCEKCDVGYFQDNNGSSVCQSCSYPYSTINTGTTAESGCTALCFCVSSSTNIAIFVTIGVLFVLGLCLLDPHSANSGGYSVFQQYLIVFGHLALPVSDVFSDVAYMFNTRFYNSAVLILIFVIFAHPILFFLRKLVLLQAWPAMFLNIQEWWWLGYHMTAKEDEEHGDVVPFPTFYGKRIVPLPHHTNILWLSFEMIIWIIAIFVQLLTVMLYFIFIPLHIMFIVVWLVFGMFLHMSKLLTVNRMWNLWFYVWTRGNSEFWVTYDSSAGYLIDTEELNSAFFIQFICGSLPQVIIQTANNTLLSEWDALGIFSVIFSGGMCLNSIYRYIYYTTLRNTKVSMRDVPVTTMFIPDIPASAKHLPRQDKLASKQQEQQETDSMKQHARTTSAIHQI